MTTITILFVITLIAGLYMTWSIGANDVANAIGTSVGSRALTLRQAVIMAALLEFSGAFFFGSHVTHTLQDRIFDVSVFGSDHIVIVFGMLAVLLGAATWILIATYYGLPISTTHSIIGALIGFAIAAGGFQSVYWKNVSYIAISWVLSPVIGGFFAFLIFSFLRKRIFYAKHPFRAAKSATPFIVFVFVFVFTFVVGFQKFPYFSESLSLQQVLLLATFLSFVGALIAWNLLRRMTLPEEETIVSRHHPNVPKEIEKTRRHLARLKNYTEGHSHARLEALSRDFDEISGELSKSSIDEIQVPSFLAIERIFSVLQVMSAALMAFSHGANDVANAIGPIAIAIDVLQHGTYSNSAFLPPWLLALGGVGIVLGLTTWGWRVIETIGNRITELTPTRGFSAEFGAAFTILVASRLGIPISATHTLVGAVLGVGFARGIGALNLSTIRDIVITWVITIPFGALISVGFFTLIRLAFS